VIALMPRLATEPVIKEINAKFAYKIVKALVAKHPPREDTGASSSNDDIRQ
jgi:hypothetical protein